MSDVSTEPPLAQVTRPDGIRLAYRHQSGDLARPGVLCLPGFRSDMTGEKTTHTTGWCAVRGVACTRLDYSGHGQSDGAFVDGHIGASADDALLVLDRVTTGPLILVGSSMGGWLMLLLAMRRPRRVVGMIGLAAAPDFTEDLIWAAMTDDQKAVMAADGRIEQPSAYGDAPDIYTRNLIEQGRRHLVLRQPIAFDGPVRLLHGQRDLDVPWQTAVDLAGRLTSDDVQVTLIKNGDHRLSQPDHLALLSTQLDEILAKVTAGQP